MSPSLSKTSFPMLAYMKMFKLPLTLEKYLALNFGPGIKLENLTAEQLSEIQDVLLKP